MQVECDSHKTIYSTIYVLANGSDKVGFDFNKLEQLFINQLFTKAN